MGDTANAAVSLRLGSEEAIVHRTRAPLRIPTVEGESGTVPHLRGLLGAVTGLTSPAAFAMRAQASPDR